MCSIIVQSNPKHQCFLKERDTKILCLQKGAFGILVSPSIAYLSSFTRSQYR